MRRSPIEPQCPSFLIDRIIELTQTLAQFLGNASPTRIADANIVPLHARYTCIAQTLHERRDVERFLAEFAFARQVKPITFL